jgi:aspartate 1-decarboxylase
MFRTLLTSKIHRATVTHCELHYEGSCGIVETRSEPAGPQAGDLPVLPIDIAH